MTGLTLGTTDWEEAYSNLREALGLPEDDKSIVVEKTPSSVPPSQATNKQHSKRKAGDDNGEEESTPENNDVKRSKSDSNGASSDSAPNEAYVHAQTAASYISFLSAESLLPPKMPTRVEMEGVILGLRKQALVEEYFGDEKAAT